MRPGRENGGADSQHRRLLHELLPGSHYDRAAHREPGRELFKRPSGNHDPGYADSPGAGGQQKPLLRQHYHQEKFPRRTADDHRRKLADRSSWPPHQGAAGGRGGRLQSQCWQRGRPDHAGRGTPDHLLGSQNGAGFHPDHQSQQPYPGRVQRFHTRGMERPLPKLRQVPAFCVGWDGVRQGEVAEGRRTIPLR